MATLSRYKRLLKNDLDDPTSEVYKRKMAENITAIAEKNLFLHEMIEYYHREALREEELLEAGYLEEEIAAARKREKMMQEPVKMPIKPLYQRQDLIIERKTLVELEEEEKFLSESINSLQEKIATVGEKINEQESIVQTQETEWLMSIDNHLDALLVPDYNAAGGFRAATQEEKLQFKNTLPLLGQSYQTFHETNEEDLSEARFQQFVERSLMLRMVMHFVNETNSVKKFSEANDNVLTNLKPSNDSVTKLFAAKNGLNHLKQELSDIRAELTDKQKRLDVIQKKINAQHHKQTKDNKSSLHEEKEHVDNEMEETHKNSLRTKP